MAWRVNADVSFLPTNADKPLAVGE